MEAVNVVALTRKNGAEIKPYDHAPDQELSRAYGLLWNLAYRSGEVSFVVDKDGVLVVGLQHCGDCANKPGKGWFRVFVVDVTPEVATYCRRADQVERAAEVGRAIDATAYLDECRKERWESGSPDELDLMLQAAGRKMVTE